MPMGEDPNQESKLMDALRIDDDDCDPFLPGENHYWTVLAMNPGRDERQHESLHRQLGENGIRLNFNGILQFADLRVSRFDGWDEYMDSAGGKPEGETITVLEFTEHGLQQPEIQVQSGEDGRKEAKADFTNTNTLVLEIESPIIPLQWGDGQKIETKTKIVIHLNPEIPAQDPKRQGLLEAIERLKETSERIGVILRETRIALTELER
jgi:hypothetical protein